MNEKGIFIKSRKAPTLRGKPDHKKTKKQTNNKTIYVLQPNLLGAQSLWNIIIGSIRPFNV